MIADISLIVTALGVLAAAFGLRQSYLERLRQFELKYVDRYWTIVDRLSPDALSGANAEPSDSDKKAIWSYLYLCEDELEMRGHGYISDDTYDVWAAGILTQLKQPMFSAVWSNVVEEPRDEGRHRFANLRELKSNAEYDPLSMSPPAKFVRGLTGSRNSSRQPVLIKPEPAREADAVGTTRAVPGNTRILEFDQSSTDDR